MYINKEQKEEEEEEEEEKEWIERAHIFQD